MKLFKRTLALVLTLCLTLSMGILVASAAETDTIECVMADDSINSLIPSGDTRVSYMSQTSVRPAATEYFRDGSSLKVLPLAYNKDGRSTNSVSACVAEAQSGNYSSDFTGVKFVGFKDDWFAVMVKNPGAGSYNVSLKYMETPTATSACEVYAMSANVVMGQSVSQTDDDYTVDADFLSNKVKNASIFKSTEGMGKMVADAMSGASKLGTVNMYSADEQVNYLMKSADLSEKLTFSASGDMILVFKSAASASDTVAEANMLISSLSLTKAAPDSGEQPGGEQPGGEQPGGNQQPGGPAQTGETATVMVFGALMIISLGAVCFLSKKRYAC